MERTNPEFTPEARAALRRVAAWLHARADLHRALAPLYEPNQPDVAEATRRQAAACDTAGDAIETLAAPQASEHQTTEGRPQ